MTGLAHKFETKKRKTSVKTKERNYKFEPKIKPDKVISVNKR